MFTMWSTVDPRRRTTGVPHRLQGKHVMSETQSDSPKITGSGNTCSSPARSRAWFFTWNGYKPEDITHLTQVLENEKYVFQEELGESGNRHLQGCCYMKSQRTFAQMKKLFGDTPHLEKCIDWPAAVKYCCKSETRNGVMYSKGVVVETPLNDVVARFGPNALQRRILDVVQAAPDDRSILWVYDKDGGGGKTTLARHLCITRKALYVSGKATDVKFAVANVIDGGGLVDIVIYGLTRSMEEYMSYEAIEAVKDGIFFCGKYESKMVVFNSPHVIVMANCLPDFDKLSRDRWKVIEV